MKLTSILCMCYCLIISTVALSQTKTVPISNMISNFSKSETKNTPMQSIDGFEVDAVVVNKDLLVHTFSQCPFKTYSHFGTSRR